MLLDGDHFISKLTLMFDKSRTNGHVQITMKRYDGRSKPIPKSNAKKNCKGNKIHEKGSKSTNDLKSKSDSTSNESGEYMCLIRAVCRKEKISCVVHARDVNRFQITYCNLLKSNMDGLKRQKKQKTKKATQ